MKKILIITLGILIITAAFVLLPKNSVKAYTNEKSYEGSIYELASSDNVTYEDYLNQFGQMPKPKVEIPVDLENYAYTNGLFDDDLPYIDSFTDDENVTKQGLYVPETGDITFTVNVESEGLYNLKLEYYSILGRSANISRGLYINDEMPFTEAQHMSFLRFWKDEYDVSENREKGKNDIRPKQIETHLWATDDFKDRVGYYGGESYAFYFKVGENTITLTSLREPVVIGSLTLYQKEPVKSYQEVLSQYEASGAKKVESTATIQAEQAYLKSSPSLNPIAEFSTYKFYPYEKFITRYNAIGGYNWRVAGDEITWQVDVSEAGLYLLTFKVMQNFSRGMNTTRTLFVNGELPFEEAKQVDFKYSSDLQYVTFGKEEPMYIYLDEGVNEIKLQANVGIYGSLVKDVNQVIYELRSIYRDVVMRIGLTPDPIQDYQLYKTIANLEARIKAAKEVLEEVKAGTVRISKGRSGLVSSFDRTIYQLERFLDDEKNIQKALSEFEQNISSLGTWVISVSEQPLTIDEIYVHGATHKFKRTTVNFFERIWHEIILFFGSFKDQGDFGSSVTVDGPTIEVWIGTGRDQTSILRQLLDESFVTQNGINVNLKMVNMGVLLSATLSGNGPDVAIGIDQKTPVNWGVRGGIYDLSQFDDFDIVKSRFSDSAMTPLMFDGKAYGLPDTEDFLVTFYREDILSSVGVDRIPETWEEVIDISPTLQKQYFEFYLPVVQGALSPVLYAMIQQYGGDLYKDNGAESALLQPESLNAFLDYTRFFTDYSFVLEANFVNRFRSGQMPIGVTYYSTYNTLAVYAPEISGQWSYGLVPGVQEGEELKQYSTSSVTASVIMGKTKQPEASWEFLKWWLSADTQTNYARGMEAVLGAAARYPTANLEAFAQLPWPAKDYIMLQKQRSMAKGIPTVPGDYIVGRHIDNAFRAVLNSSAIPQDSLYNYHLKINEELARKREELGIQ